MPHVNALRRYVGIGWQLNNIPSHYSHLEEYEIEEARALKALRPDVRVSVLRNTEVATVFWDSAKAKMYDPNTQDFWTQCNGKPCKGSWDSPAGNTDKVQCCMVTTITITNQVFACLHFSLFLFNTLQ